MASLFECEVRYEIEDISALESKLGELCARIIYPYEFNDYYFRPLSEQWSLSEKNLRIRDWKTPENPTTVFFVKTEIVMIDGIQFKRALYPQGKVPLFSGTLDDCARLLEDMGFESWFTIRKTMAKLWEIPDHGFITAVEYIEDLGWSGELEFEGEYPEKAAAGIKRALELLKVPGRAVSYKPISRIFTERMGIR